MLCCSPITALLEEAAKWKFFAEVTLEPDDEDELQDVILILQKAKKEIERVMDYDVPVITSFQSSSAPYSSSSRDTSRDQKEKRREKEDKKRRSSERDHHHSHRAKKAKSNSIGSEDRSGSEGNNGGFAFSAEAQTV